MTLHSTTAALLCYELNKYLLRQFYLGEVEPEFNRQWQLQEDLQGRWRREKAVTALVVRDQHDVPRHRSAVADSPRQHAGAATA